MSGVGMVKPMYRSRKTRPESFDVFVGDRHVGVVWKAFDRWGYTTIGGTGERDFPSRHATFGRMMEER